MLGGQFMKTIIVVVNLLMILTFSFDGYAQNYSIGVFYYPGWKSDYINWNDLKGLPSSKSPGKEWPDREPLLGFYPEEKPWVAEKHIEWASQYGITFFAYDWYWNGKRPEYDHALKNYLASKKRDKLQYCLLWANHFPVPSNLTEYDDMVDYWIGNYFNQPTYFQIDGKPLVFIFSNLQLEMNAKKFGESVKSLLIRADSKARSKGHKGIYFVITTNDIPDNSLEKKLFEQGFSAYTGWNYALAKGFRVDDYNMMVEGYLDFYNAAAKTLKILPYIVPASSGYDERPWHGGKAIVRNNPTPEKFERMLSGAKAQLDKQQIGAKILMIEAWNEFAEGSYIEPTKKWGFAYLETIKKIFSSTAATTTK